GGQICFEDRLHLVSGGVVHRQLWHRVFLTVPVRVTDLRIQAVLFVGHGRCSGQCQNERRCHGRSHDPGTSAWVSQRPGSHDHSSSLSTVVGGTQSHSEHSVNLFETFGTEYGVTLVIGAAAL